MVRRRTSAQRGAENSTTNREYSRVISSGGETDNVVVTRGAWSNNSRSLAAGASVHGSSASSVQSRFDEACEKIRASSQKYLEKSMEADGNGSCEDDEEIDPEIDDNDKSAIICKLFGEKAADNGIVDNSGAHDDTRERMWRSLDADASTCLICIAVIRRAQPIWTCQSCRVFFHIGCVTSWAQDNINQRRLRLAAASEDATLGGASTGDSVGWNCPGCRREYTVADVPRRYTCFCGKCTDPPCDPWLLPHTCGEPCHRPLQPDCGHRCLLRCHPGRCPPCAVTVSISCHCKQAPARAKRCSNRLWSCGAICGRWLNCGAHRCEKQCHVGECTPCDKTSVKKCNCGARRQMRPCSDTEFQCDKVCGASLSCGHHTCARVCHVGPCGPCPESGRRSCPCGSTWHELPCTEQVATCGGTCDKLLDCGWHRCCNRCHTGQCGRCLQMRVKKCRCGRREKEMVCNKAFLCEIKCRKMKSCGVHTCNRKCCGGDCAPCDMVCGRLLSCGRHRCAAQCHTGPCYPCSRTTELSCPCGSARQTVPCGLRRRSQTLRCRVPCSVPPTCHHAMRMKHPCHPPPCPPCRQPCERRHAVCDHVCGWPCHDEVVQIAAAGGSTAAQKQRKITVSEPCPPCQQMVSVECAGGHCDQNIRCSRALLLTQLTCELTCGRVLSCSNHTCTLPCHEVLDAVDKTSAGSNCETCERPCLVPRAAGCQHVCAAVTCHEAPCPPCRQHRRVQCHCRLSFVYVRCWRLSALTGGEGGDEGGDGGMNGEGLERFLCCGNTCPKKLSCGHKCRALCHSGECPAPSGGCQAKRRLTCQCARRRTAVFACNSVSEATTHLPCDEQCQQCQQQQREKEETGEDRDSGDVRQDEQQQLWRPYGRRRRRKVQYSDNSDNRLTVNMRRAAVVIVATVTVVVTVFYFYS